MSQELDDLTLIAGCIQFIEDIPPTLQVLRSVNDTLLVQHEPQY